MTTPLPSTPSTVSLTLVVPVYNEEQRFAEHGGEILEFVRSFGPGSELVVVDDGSTDRTCDVVEDFETRAGRTEIRLLRRPHRGKGAAVQAGLESARAPLAGFCDIDLATPLDELERLCLAATTGPVLVAASRDVVSTELVGRESDLRELLGKSYNRLLRLTVTPGIHDTQCGAKVAPTAVWREVLPYCRESGFAWDAEALAVARRRGIAVWELGVRWAHDPRSRVRPGRDGVAMIRAVPRIWHTVRRVPSLVEGPSAHPIGMAGFNPTPALAATAAMAGS